MSQPRRILVTSALPYANGHIHLGHLVEYLQTDIWVRFQKLRGHAAVYVCADDTHGTAIMIRARQEGISEEDAYRHDARRPTSRTSPASRSSSTTTAAPTARRIAQFCEEIWAALRKAGLVSEKEVTQLYDPVAGTFLADRFVKGTCPNPDAAGTSTAIAAKLRHALQPHRPDRPGEHAFRVASRRSARPSTCS